MCESTENAQMDGTKCRISPLLKWPGGKRALLGELRAVMPVRYDRYFEPFLGGGALFFELCPKNAVLGDHNNELIDCYSEVRDNPEEVIESLQTMVNSEEDYYKIRGQQPGTNAEHAARLIYLVSLSFNGIFRVNLKGDFNVPYGYRPI